MIDGQGDCQSLFIALGSPKGLQAHLGIFSYCRISMWGAINGDRKDSGIPYSSPKAGKELFFLLLREEDLVKDKPRTMFISQSAQRVTSAVC